MKRLLPATLLILFLLGFVQVSRADSASPSIAIYSLWVQPILNNAGYTFLGPGVDLSGASRASCASQFCDGVSFLAGTTISPDLALQFYTTSGSISLSGTTYLASQYSFALFDSSITASGTITFPSGGNIPFVYNLALPASFGPLYGQVNNGPGFRVWVPKGQFRLSFTYQPGANGNPGSYTFLQGMYYATTPEPGTLLLVGSGLCGLLGLAKRRKQVSA